MPLVEDEIRDLVVANATLAVDDSRLAADTDLFNAGMTSYQSVTVMMTIEEHFGIEFPDSMIRRSTFQTIGALAEAVTSLLGSSRSP